MTRGSTDRGQEGALPEQKWVAIGHRELNSVRSYKSFIFSGIK